MIIAVDMEIRISLLQAVQAVFFFSLLIAVSAWDLRYRIIPDRFQAGIALLSFLNFAPRQLFGALGAVPYLIVALFCKREGGMGGGDIKLAGATGLVLGLPASLTASCLGLTGFVMYGCMVCLWNRFKGKRDKEAFPVGPFLAGERAMEGMYPGFTRPVLFSYRFYNQDLTTGSLLIEIGGHGNNLNEALYAGQLAAKGLAAALLGGA